MSSFVSACMSVSRKFSKHLAGRTVIRIRYNITTGRGGKINRFGNEISSSFIPAALATGDFQYGSLAHPKEENAELSGLCRKRSVGRNCF